MHCTRYSLQGGVPLYKGQIGASLERMVIVGPVYKGQRLVVVQCIGAWRFHCNNMHSTYRELASHIARYNYNMA